MSVAATGRLNAFMAVLPAKGRAVGIHMAISLVLFLALLYLILVEWYPGFLFHTDGGWQGIRLMFAIDMVLGPLLTFVVFNPLKPRREIIMDLSLVALTQAAALAWGVHAVYSQHPVAMVEYKGAFYSVVAEAYTSQDIDLATLQKYDHREPAVIFQREAKGMEDIMTLMQMKEQWQQFAQLSFYERISDRLPQVFMHAVDFESEITAVHPQLTDEFRQMRERHDPSVGFLPFNGRYGAVILVLTRQGEVIDFMAMPG